MKLFHNKLFVFTLILVLTAITIMLVAFLGGGQNTPLGKAVGAVVTPIEGALAKVGDWFSGLFGYFYRYSALETENAQLRSQLAGYKELEAEYWEAVNENEELRKLNNLRARHRDFDLEMCSVISYDGNGYLSALTINRGESSGIEVDDPVVVEGGLVGYVTYVGPNYANVATLLHQRTKVNAMISRTRELGILEGEFQISETGKLKLSYLPNDADVRAGDQVVSTGGISFPKGLIIGTVIDFQLESHGASSYATIEPAVDLENLTGVFVVKAFEVVD